MPYFVCYSAHGSTEIWKFAISQNHGITQVGKDPRDHQVQPSALTTEPITVPCPLVPQLHIS